MRCSGFLCGRIHRWQSPELIGLKGRTRALAQPCGCVRLRFTRGLRRGSLWCDVGRVRGEDRYANGRRSHGPRLPRDLASCWWNETLGGVLSHLSRNADSLTESMDILTVRVHCAVGSSQTNLFHYSSGLTPSPRATPFKWSSRNGVQEVNPMFPCHATSRISRVRVQETSARRLCSMTRSNTQS